MRNLPHHATATVRLFSTAEGGRCGPIPAVLHCLLQVGTLNLDVRLFSDKGLGPEQTGQVGLTFLNPALARQHCSAGLDFKLREAGIIGTGLIDEVRFGREECPRFEPSRVA